MTIQAEDSPAAPVNAEARIAIDLPCLKCGYDLRTLELTGLCPECGKPVAESTTVYLSRPCEWLNSVGDAADLLGAVWFTLSGVLSLIGIAAGLSGTPAMFVGALLLAMLFVVLCGILLIALTRPEPGCARPWFSARRLIRCCLVTIPACLMAMLATLAPFRPVAAADVVLGCLFLAPVALLPPALLRHLSNLLSRAPDSNPCAGHLRMFGRVLFWFVLGLEAVGGSLVACAILHTGLSILDQASIALAALSACALFATAVFFMRAGVALKLAAEQRRRWAAQLRSENPPAGHTAQDKP